MKGNIDMENKNYWENSELEFNSQNNLFLSLVNYMKNHENIENVDCSRLNFSKKGNRTVHLFCKKRKSLYDEVI